MAKENKITAIVQARMGSNRLPGKVLMPLAETKLISLLLARLSRSITVDDIIVALPETKTDAKLQEYINSIGFKSITGPENDVLSRYFLAAQMTNASNIVRITGDCPLVDPDIVDSVVIAYLNEGVDYCSNVCPPTFPDGFDVEVFSFSALEKAFRKETNQINREHVTIQFRNGDEYSSYNVSLNTDLSALKLSVDTEDDYKRVARICDFFAGNTTFSWQQALDAHEHIGSDFS